MDPVGRMTVTENEMEWPRREEERFQGPTCFSLLLPHMTFPFLTGALHNSTANGKNGTPGELLRVIPKVGFNSK